MLLVPLFCLMSTALGKASVDDGMHAKMKGTIGLITDNNSRNGKEEIVAVKMAMEDFHHYSNQSFDLQIRDSHADSLQAALAARDLIDTQKVEAIIGPDTWKETTSVADICSQNVTPVLSLADATPDWSTLKWPYLVQISPNQFKQMKAVAAIVQSFEWYNVNIIYDDTDSSSTRMFSHLYRDLSVSGVHISNVLAIPPLSSSSLPQELEKLRNGFCRVFVVNLSVSLAINLFQTAKELKMMEKGYVWIVTDPLTSLVHSLNSSTISLMQGIVGVKSYFPEIGLQYKDFYSKFRKKFSLENPHELNNEPGIFAARAYDAAWTLALSMNQTTNKKDQTLLDKILLNNFTGLGGKIHFTDQKLDPSDTFQIINVMGEDYKEIGFWRNGLGFSNIIGQNAVFNSSMKELGQVLWPGRPWGTPRGWILALSKPLRIGVPVIDPLKQSVTVIQDQTDNTTTFQGFTIDIFRATMDLLPYHLPYKLYPFNGTYDNLVKQVYLKNFDAVIDVSIISYRYQYAEFTQPYTDPGVLMVVPVKSKVDHRGWLFMKPFTKTMWVLILAMVIYNGFILWMLERRHSPEIRGSMLNQTGTMAWLALTPLIKLDGDKLHSNLSKMVMVVWLFVALIITQTYTANLASMLTAERLEPTVDNIDRLRNSYIKVGYSSGSFLKHYIEKVLQFHPENMRNYGELEEFAEAFRRKEIGVAFLEVPAAKIFLAKYCKEFIQAGPLYKVGGFGFAFPRGSPLIPDVNKALLDLVETGKVSELENKMLASEKCEDTEVNGETASLSPNSFWVLFILTGGTSTFSILVYVFRMNYANSEEKTIWRLTTMIIQQCNHAKRRMSRKVSDVAENPTTSSTTHATPTQV
ncbi:glutamate receptor 2.8-like [Vigna radiata var. radiata]|uniref:Glutamate receptor n=1 Tax=Vigna radiata var. radiata TaxID=3916 RepID=A0A1S3U3X3_VIGRR|nr:glutamate receptor 2.8-like [Vigna radiata var. radiata]